MGKYKTLVRILDQIRNESASTGQFQKYIPAADDTERVNQARARAFIHLFLKVRFGLTDFAEREHYVTDGAHDGGIDGYYIDKDNRTIFLLQSKFRNTELNFESKNIALEEILVMDIDRITSGEECDEAGNQYNGKIRQLIREISQIEDIARYKYKVILLANLPDVSDSQLRRLSGGHTIETFNHEKCYQHLVFPVISGCYFNASDLVINIDLSNKTAGSKISYAVQTKHHETEITVLFVPTIEIARVMHKYKNAILKFNPRSYLEIQGAKVNSAIRNTILSNTTNEFALLNNGITIISDETSINERIGTKNKAQLHVRNPQIINGGQTAYTLSRLYAEMVQAGNIPVFDNKEVLVKIITLTTKQNDNDEQQMELIEQISTATNQQSVVTYADRSANDRAHVQMQRILFDKYGLLYERKAGEFSEGQHSGYIKSRQIVERNLFLRVFLAANGKLQQSFKKRIFADFDTNAFLKITDAELDKFLFGFLCYKKLRLTSQGYDSKNRVALAKISVLTRLHMPSNLTPSTEVQDIVSKFENDWAAFVSHVATTNSKFVRVFIDASGQAKTGFREERWIASLDFERDVKSYFYTSKPTPPLILS